MTHMKISQYFTDTEAYTTSHRELDNTPSSEIWPVIFAAAQKMDVVRRILQCPVHVNSWYRSIKLNRLIGSKDTSQHLKGEAVDFVCPEYGSPLEIVKRLDADKEILSYDQLILEHNWVHISFAINSPTSTRKQTLTLLASGKYSAGITDLEGNTIV